MKKIDMTCSRMFVCVVVVVFLQSYGWFIVLGLAVAFYFKGHIERTFNRWYSSRQEEADYHRYGIVWNHEFIAKTKF